MEVFFFFLIVYGEWRVIRLTRNIFAEQYFLTQILQST